MYDTGISVVSVCDNRGTMAWCFRASSSSSDTDDWAHIIVVV